jgi:hypothetical protein
LFSTALNEFDEPHADPVPVVAVWDEYRNTLARYPLATESLSYSAGMGFIQVCVWQDCNQMAPVTSPSSWQTLLGTCALKAFARPSENFTANWLSERLGETEVITQQQSVGYAADLDWSNIDQRHTRHVTVNKSTGTRRLMAPQELNQLPDDPMVILSDDLPFPALALREPYYKPGGEFEGLYGPDPTYPDSWSVKGAQPRWNKAVNSFVFGKGHRNTGALIMPVTQDSTGRVRFPAEDFAAIVERFDTGDQDELRDAVGDAFRFCDRYRVPFSEAAKLAYRQDGAQESFRKQCFELTIREKQKDDEIAKLKEALAWSRARWGQLKEQNAMLTGGAKLCANCETWRPVVAGIVLAGGRLLMPFCVGAAAAGVGFLVGRGCSRCWAGGRRVSALALVPVFTKNKIPFVARQRDCPRGVATVERALKGLYG